MVDRRVRGRQETRALLHLRAQLPYGRPGDSTGAAALELGRGVLARDQARPLLRQLLRVQGAEGGTLDHNAHYYAESTTGTSVIETEPDGMGGEKLTLKFISDNYVH